MRRSLYMAILISAFTMVPAVSAKDEARPRVQKERAAAIQLYKSARLIHRDGRESGTPDYGRIEGLLRKAVGIDKSFTTAYILLGQIYEEQLKWGEAVDVYRNASRYSFNKERGFVYLGRAYAAMGKNGNAKKILESVIRRNPYSSKAKSSLAAMYRREGKLELAGKVLKSALEHATNAIDTYKELALLHIQKNQITEAKLALLKASMIKKSDAETQNIFGLLHLKLKENQLAVDSFKKAIELDPFLVPARLNLSAIYLEQGYFDKALTELEVAKNLRPRDPVILSSMGVCYRGQGKYREAERFYAKAIEMNSRYQPAIYNMGLLHYKYLNNPQTASKYFDRYSADRINPKMVSAPKEDLSGLYIKRIELTNDKMDEIKGWDSRTSDALESYMSSRQRREKIQVEEAQHDKRLDDLFGTRRTLESKLVKNNRELTDSRKERKNLDDKLVAAVKNVTRKRAELGKSLVTLIKGLDGVNASLQGQKQQANNFERIERSFRKAASERLSLESSLQRASGSQKGRLIQQAIDKHSKQVQDFNQIVSDLGRNSNDIERAIRSLGKVVNRVHNNNKEAQDVAGQIEQNSTSLQSIDKKLDGLEKKIAIIDKRRADLERNIIANRDDRISLERERKAQENELPGIIEDSRKVEAKLTSLDRTRSMKGRRLLALEKQRQQLVSEIRDFGQLLSSTGGTFVDNEKARRALALAYDKLAQQMKTLQEKRNGLTQQSDRLLSDRRKASQSIERLIKRQTSLQDRLKRLNQERSEKQQAMTTAFSQRSKLHNFLTKVGSAIEANKGDFKTALKAAMSGHKKAPAQLMAQAKGLDAAAIQAQNGALEAQNDLVKRSAGVMKKRDEVNALIGKVDTAKNSWSKVATSISRTTKSRDSFGQKMQVLESQRSQLLREYNRNEKQLASTVSRRDRASAARNKVLDDEMGRFKKLIDVDQERRAKVRRDLLSQGKKKGRKK